MAFCGSCGAQMEGNQRFCGSCGADQGAAAPAAPVATPAPVAVTPVPPPVVAVSNPLPPPLYTASPVAAPIPAAPPSYAPPPVAAAPMPPTPPPYAAPAPPPRPYAAPPFPQAMPGQPPIIMGAPPTQPAKNNKTMWIVIGIAAVGVFYYIGTHDKQTTQPNTQPTTQPQQQPQPAANPGQQPPGQGTGGGGEAQLAQMQSFTGQVGESNGQVQISNGKWTNNATVSIQSSNLQCVQTGNGNQALTQTNTTLTGPNGPLPPNSSTTFNPFLVGAVVQGATGAQCQITSVVPGN